MTDSPSVDPRWASTDLRWRGSSTNSARSKNAAPLTPRGYVEDYGDDRANTKGLMTGPRLWLWRCRNITISAPLICAIAVTSCAISVEFSDRWVVKIASLLTIFASFLLLFQRQALKRLGNLKRQNRELQRQVHYMRQERERLHRTLDRLDEKVADLHSIPKELHKLTKHKNVDQLIELVQENQKIQDEMRKNVQKQIMQQIMSLVVRVDRDRNWTLRPTEIEALIVRLGLMKNIEFNEQRLRQMLQYDPTITTIMRIIRSLVERDDEYEHGNPIFRIKS